MDYWPQREALQAELQKRGLPRAYINRLLEELDDHFSDLADDLVSTERNHDMSAARMPEFRVNELDGRMGSPTELANFAAEQYRARSFFGRHPVFTFLVTPLPLLVVTWFLYWAVMAVPALGISYVLKHVVGVAIAEEDHPWLQCFFLMLLSWEIMVFGPLTAGWWLCRVAKHNALDWRWPVAACVLIALLLAFLTLSWNPKYSPGENGVFMIGLISGSSLGWFVLTWLPKFALALGIGLALVWREERRDRGEISDTPATISTLPAA